MNPEFTFSKIIQGHMHLADWKLNKEALISHTYKLIEIGIDTFDHADIYGNYTCEALFGEALSTDKSLRNNIKIISKCGIKLISDKYPNRKIKHYAYSCEEIVNSVEQSLLNLNTSYLDLLLLHRPSPLLNPHEVASAFEKLKSSGKVSHFGVSNFSIEQFKLLESAISQPLICNQIEISPYNLTALDNDDLNFMMRNRIIPMAWSPAAGGKIHNPIDEKGKRILNELISISHELNLNEIDSVLFAWLFKHPAGILPVLGTSSLDRAKLAIEAQKLILTTEQWFRIYCAGLGRNVA